jgi:hypothetical protein
MTDTGEEVTDTSNEAVERLIAGSTSEPWEQDAVVMLSALLRERNAECDARTLAETNLAMVEAERDRLREALKDVLPHVGNSYDDDWIGAGVCHEAERSARAALGEGQP